MGFVRAAVLFTDGVGMGVKDPQVNPLCTGEYLLSQFADGSGTVLPPGVRRFITDTTFGVPGRPQSASNQTAIFTASPAPRRIGRHVLGYPNAELRGLLERESIVKRLVAAGRTAAFANSYPREYLRLLDLPHDRVDGGAPHIVIAPKVIKKLKASASTLAFAAAGVPLKTFDDARAGRGLTHDIDGSAAARRQVVVPQRTAEEAATIFWSLQADFTLFEHYLADEAGHAQDRAAAVAALSTFDAFARAVMAQRPADAVVLVCSDHGNVEDLSVRSHTTNPVSVLCAADDAVNEKISIATVADVGRTVLDLLEAV